MERPCKNPYCKNEVPHDAPARKEYCDDTCGRAHRRLKAEGEGAEFQRSEAFWDGLKAKRPLGRGWGARRGTRRQVVT